MKFDPRNFYFGVVDFFSIMLPGGLLSFYLYNPLGEKLFGPILPAIPAGSSSTLWVVFLFAAYLLGHIVFLAGSYLDITYDMIRPMIWPREKDHAFKQTEELKKQILGEGRANTMNTFQWAKAVLRLNHPEGLMEVARFEADSKFFRSLFMVLLFLFLFELPSENGALMLFLLPIVIILAYCRYAERRHKSTEQAYRHTLVLDSLGKLEKGDLHG